MDFLVRVKELNFSLVYNHLAFECTISITTSIYDFAYCVLDVLLHSRVSILLPMLHSGAHHLNNTGLYYSSHSYLNSGTLYPICVMNDVKKACDLVIPYLGLGLG